MREPLWSLKDLAGHTKVAYATLQSRSKTDRQRASNPFPQQKHFDSKFSGFNGHNYAERIKGLCGSGTASRYKKSELLAWFNAEDQHKPFKRES
uniref:Uncharacterized protein n=1 Tax=Pseudomonas phage HRDY3 TaxID=3236930 RepID=A0AB39CDU0_9VIRU